MQVVYELAPVIAEIISGHCAGTTARGDFMTACLHGEWAEARAMVEGMLAEPWHLVGHQESRLREFLGLLQVEEGPPGDACCHAASPSRSPSQA